MSNINITINSSGQIKTSSIGQNTTYILNAKGLVGTNYYGYNIINFTLATPILNTLYLQQSGSLIK